MNGNFTVGRCVSYSRGLDRHPGNTPVDSVDGRGYPIDFREPGAFEWSVWGIVGVGILILLAWIAVGGWVFGG